MVNCGGTSKARHGAAQAAHVTSKSLRSKRHLTGKLANQGERRRRAFAHQA
jgi:hypothetical protein